ncbi:NADPH-dependent FMN reductase [candidate division GN15 bacterium]|nr:NADPH-dependent FMN reductase [candidate division GN15 bacterium]
MTADSKPLYIPLILGTPRKGRKSKRCADFVFAALSERDNVKTEFIDVCDLPLPTDDAGEQIKIPEFSQKMWDADGLIIVTPEYNHSYPGMLKHALDSNLKEYIHKAVGLVGVSAGIFGGARVIEHFLPVLREVGLTAIFTDINFGPVDKIFDDSGKLLDDAFHKRTAGFLDELIWMSTVLRWGRENVPSPFHKTS